MMYQINCHYLSDKTDDDDDDDDDVYHIACRSYYDHLQ